MSDFKEWLVATPFFLLIALAISAIPAYLTHLFWTIGTCMNETAITGGQVMLMIAGLFVPPVGVLHGWYIWF